MQLEPAPDLDKFVDGLSVSPKLKAWMKKNHTAQLAGRDFTNLLTADDIVDTPEFYNAYMFRNSGYEGNGFPKPKFNLKDEVSNPENSMTQKQSTRKQSANSLAGRRTSIPGIEAGLTESTHP